MNNVRAGGLLCHPTSFYSPYGIGDLGRTAYEFIDFLQASGCSLWQVLPLNPTGYGDSPYQTFSAFAGNPYLIGVDDLLERGWLEPRDLDSVPEFECGRVDFGQVIPWKLSLLEIAFARVRGDRQVMNSVAAFAEAAGTWLDDYALFMALKGHHGGQPWASWQPEYRDSHRVDRPGLAVAFAEQILRQQFYQYLFFEQWGRLRAHAGANGVQIIGDVPIYVAHDSADVWANPELFLLDEVGRPTVVAGVPPDYFSPLGQLWGNPIYRWERHAEDGYSWWVARLRGTLDMVDLVRMDHFRGFAGFWEIPGAAENAVNGRWVPGPGAALFDALRTALGGLPMIAEDLGEITPDVLELRDKFDLPGMKIFQFGFSGDPDHEFLPHTYPENSAGYTGSHDNEPLWGWFLNAPLEQRQNALRYLGISAEQDFCWAMIESLWASRAERVVAQVQDLLEVGDEGRMNVPSVPSGNWQWQMKPGELNLAQAAKLRAIAEKSRRH